ncbi:hypothetical protein WSK_1010 [Novosphingobium sp. Rr 2-17]|uniref:hypothetical protein n=1 Tax=Novosphingobium sp. Rr 2-17 TaxID=555793 RepID=UPI0002699833|nr:hypothetical protein [Novosphingobium sp. Rr 2-17]EIZ80450.1 hypothetical protein WSK_1010 [Novosphingobium sp. Rr 2-17]
MNKLFIAAALATAFATPATVMAQAAPATAPSAAAPNPTVGAKVFGPDGVEVGTVEAVSGDVVTVYTGTARAGVPKNAFAMREKGLTIGMSKSQLEAAVNGAQAQNGAQKDAALVADAPVKSSDGKVLGTIAKVEGEDVTVTLTDGKAAALKKSYIGLGADGSLALGMTAADFAKATQAAASAQPGTEAGAGATAQSAATEQPSAQ